MTDIETIMEVHGVSKQEAVVLQQQLSDLEDDANIFESGMTSAFWRVLKKHMQRASEMAVRQFMLADVTDIKLMTKLQVQARLYEEVENLVKDTIEEARAQLEELTAKPRKGRKA